MPSIKNPSDKKRVSNTVSDNHLRKQEGETEESCDLQGKLFYYIQETQEERNRENIFLFSSHEIIQILLCAKGISLLLSFDRRHLTHCCKGEIKNKTAGKYWKRKLNGNCISPSSSVFCELCFETQQ